MKFAIRIPLSVEQTQHPLYRSVQASDHKRRHAIVLSFRDPFVIWFTRYYIWIIIVKYEYLLHFASRSGVFGTAKWHWSSILWPICGGTESERRREEEMKTSMWLEWAQSNIAMFQMMKFWCNSSKCNCHKILQTVQIIMKNFLSRFFHSKASAF